MAIVYSHERSELRPSNRSSPRHAFTSVSWTASSASWIEPRKARISSGTPHLPAENPRHDHDQTKRPLAAGGIRISELAGRGRNGKRLHSDTDQRGKLDRDCDEFGLDLDYVFEELDTSGTLPLVKRPKLLDALERMEHGEIKAIVFPYRDRSDRSIKVMTEVVERVDRANGLLIAGGPC